MGATSASGARSTSLDLARFDDERGRREYLAAYDEALTLWPLPRQNVVIPTRFGPTGAVVCGPEDGPPIVLLPAATGTGAVQWHRNAAGLAAQRRVYAIDFVGGPGRGIQTRAIVDRADCAAWLTDVLDHLELDAAETSLARRRVRGSRSTSRCWSWSGFARWLCWGPPPPWSTSARR